MPFIHLIFQGTITVNESNFASLELSTQPGTQAGLHPCRQLVGGGGACDLKTNPPNKFMF